MGACCSLNFANKGNLIVSSPLSEISKEEREKLKDEQNCSILVNNTSEQTNYKVKYVPSSTRKMLEENAGRKRGNFSNTVK